MDNNTENKNNSQTPSVPPYEAKENNEKKKEPLKIIIPVVAAAVVIAAAVTAVFVTRKGGTDKPTFYATDVNGVVALDPDGNPVTVEAQTEIIAVTGENGETYVDVNGTPITTVIYKETEVKVPVTDKKGNVVTDASGEVVTEKRTVKPSPEAIVTTTKPKTNVVGTTAVPITDGRGNTGVDPSGNIITTIIDITEAPTAVIEPAKIEWKATLGGSAADYFSAVEKLPDGSFVTAMVTNSKDGDFSGNGADEYVSPYTVLTKYGNDGKVIWQKTYGNTSGITTVTALAADADGNFYASGYGRNVFGIKTRAYYDGFVAKFDKNGELLWAKTFGTSTVDLFNDVALTPDGGVVAVGSVGNNDGDARKTGGEEFKSRACIVKYTANGELVWKNIVGNDKDTFNGVAVTDDGSIFTVGNFYSGTLFPAMGKSDSGVSKFSADGKYINTVPVAGTGNENFTAITATSDGGVAICGRSDSADIDNTDSFFKNDLIARGGYDAFLVKFNGNLALVFATPFRGQNDDSLDAITELENGNIITTGYTNSSTRDLKGVTTRGGKDMIIVSFNKNGDLLWKRSFGGTLDDFSTSICVGSDGSYIVAGRTISSDVDLEGMTSLTGTGKSVGIIVKFPQ